jgi:hypothetical protein
MSATFWMAVAGALLCLGPARGGRFERNRNVPSGERRFSLSAVSGLAVGLASLALGGTWGIFAAPVLAIGAALMVRWLNLRTSVTVPEVRSVAFVLDLIASALAGGAPPEAAIAAVAGAARDSQSTRLIDAIAPLERVGRLLQLGADPAAAWSALDSVAGFAPVASAGRRCAKSGARLAGAFRATAHDLRAGRQTDALARAERVGIWSLLPLGLCFLPAFVCIGVAPVIAGIAAQVLGGIPS